MRAIILAYDTLEPLNGSPCFCMKNSSIGSAKKLIKYLREYLFFKKEQIAFWRGSRFRNSEQLLMELRHFIEANSGEDLLLHYSGHGSKFGWNFRNSEFCGSLRLGYECLEKVFENFSGRLVMINDCCCALSADRYLRKIRSLNGRYLLLGASRKNNLGLTYSGLIDGILHDWLKRRPADPRVASALKIKGDMRTADDLPYYPVFRCLNNIIHSSPCGHPRSYAQKEYKIGKQPSLRRGSFLDHLCFPPR